MTEKLIAHSVDIRCKIHTWYIIFSVVSTSACESRVGRSKNSAALPSIGARQLTDNSRPSNVFSYSLPCFMSRGFRYSMTAYKSQYEQTSITFIVKLHKWMYADTSSPLQRSAVAKQHRDVKIWPQECIINEINVKTGTNPYSDPIRPTRWGCHPNRLMSQGIFWKTGTNPYSRVCLTHEAWSWPKPTRKVGNFFKNWH